MRASSSAEGEGFLGGRGLLGGMLGGRSRSSSAQPAACAQPSGAAHSLADAACGTAPPSGLGSCLNGPDGSSSSPAFPSLTLAEAEQLCVRFFRREFASLITMHTDDALERLHRLQMLTKLPPISQSSTPQTSYQSYVPVPISSALQTLRRAWGDSSRGPGHHAPPPATAMGRMGASGPALFLQLLHAPELQRRESALIDEGSSCANSPGSPTGSGRLWPGGDGGGEKRR